MGILLDDAIILLKGLNKFPNKEFKTVISLGSPDFYFTYDELEKLASSIGLFFENNSNSKYPKFEDFFKNLGFNRFIIVDLDSSADFKLDLNVLIKNDHELVKKGDLVLDCGTSHYIFNVKNLFQNVFNITKIGGCIYHSIGSNGYYDQAFYQFSPTLLIKVYKNLEILFSCQIFPKNQRLVKNYFHNSYYYNSPNKSKTLIAFFILKVENSKLNLNPQFEYNYLTNSKNKEGLNLTENEVLYDKRSFNKKIRNLVYENINNILEKIHFI